MQQKKSEKRFKKWKHPEIKHQVPTKWGWIVWYPENLELGKNTDIGYGCYLQAEKGIVIGDNVEVTIVDVRGDKVRLGITAPKDVPVHRREIYDAIQREKREKEKKEK